MPHPDQIFSLSSDREFELLALETFRCQYEGNEAYREFVDACHITPARVTRPAQIPFLPISLFKSRDVITRQAPPQAVFRSSGTTGQERSRHMVSDLGIYRRSFLSGFERFFGPVADVQFLALAPNVEQAPDSSLVYMLEKMMDRSSSPENGFFLSNHSGLKARLTQKRAPGRKVMMIGLAYALLDFAEAYPGDYSPMFVVETGGMKGHRPEITRDELHARLCPALGVDRICSEYGMTELLSQAWSQGDGLFSAPPWMRVMIRDLADPFSWVAPGEVGGISIIDLANIHSCSFIATEDLGRLHPDGRFEVLGRFAASEVRGCSLLI